MFITSLIPLWLAIVFIDCWEMVDGSIKKWNSNISTVENLSICASTYLLQIISITIIIFVVVVSLICINRFLRSRADGKNNYATLKSAKKESKLTTEYLLSYILPLIAFDFGNLRDVILFLGFFAILAFLCIKNNNLYTNIYLELRKYKIYTCDIAVTVMDKENIYTECFVLSKQNLTQCVGENLNMWEFENRHKYIIINKEKNK